MQPANNNYNAPYRLIPATLDMEGIEIWSTSDELAGLGRSSLAKGFVAFTPGSKRVAEQKKHENADMLICSTNVAL